MFGDYAPPGKKPKKLDPLLVAHEQRVLDNPDYYVCTLFKGAGKFERQQRATLELARATASIMVVGQHRPVGIYAVRDGKDVIMELVEPPKG